MLRRAATFLLTWWAFVLICPPRTQAAKPNLHSDARVALQATIAAAKAKDWTALRAMMVSKFTWSFGDDDDADAAIAEWKREPRYMRGLLRVLAKGCQMKGAEHVECLGRGDLAFRAGLVKEDGAWKLGKRPVLAISRTRRGEGSIAWTRWMARPKFPQIPQPTTVC